MDIFGALGVGSGLDTAKLVKDLVAAQRAPFEKRLEDRAARVEARISALGQFRTALDALNRALAQRIADGAVSAVATVSDPTILAVRLDPGVTLASQAIRVRALAAPQTLASAPVADPAAAVGQGTLTVRFGTVAGTGPATGFVAGSLPDLTVTVGPGNDSLTGLRDAFNDAAAQAGAPLQAQILTDSEGSRLVLRGAFGAASGFLVEASGDPGLEAYAFAVGSGGLSRTAVAADAEVVLDGVTLRRPTNSIADLVPGARLTLLRAAPDTPVLLSAERSAGEMAGVVRDLAVALSELLGIGRELTRGGSAGENPGALAANATARGVLAGLGTLTTRPLIPAEGSAPRTLAELGLTTTREGALRVNEARLGAAVRDHPAAVERLIRALVEPASLTSPGGPLRQLATQLAEAVSGRLGAPTALARERQDIARERLLLEERMTRLAQSLTRQFQLVDLRVGQAREIGSALKLQIDLWRRNDR
ncbi:flagellar filament capping protein FliD [Thermaurantiacus sp.]